jgi:hypothetical protein
MRSRPYISIFRAPADGRDEQLLRLAARFGLLEVAHVMQALGVGRTSAYRRVAELTDAGLLDRVPPLRRGPALVRATREGLRYAGVPAMPVAVPRPGEVGHCLRCAALAIRLEADLAGGDGELLSERELTLAERVEGRPIASAPVTRHGRPGLHRPDLAIIDADRVVACEVELSVKAPRRLEEIVRAWRRASHVDEVRYLCGSPGVRRAVRRAVAATHADEKVRVEELGR